MTLWNTWSFFATYASLNGFDPLDPRIPPMAEQLEDVLRAAVQRGVARAYERVRRGAEWIPGIPRERRHGASELPGGGRGQKRAASLSSLHDDDRIGNGGEKPVPRSERVSGRGGSGEEGAQESE